MTMTPHQEKIWLHVIQALRLATGNKKITWKTLEEDFGKRRIISSRFDDKRVIITLTDPDLPAGSLGPKYEIMFGFSGNKEDTFTCTGLDGELYDAVDRLMQVVSGDTPNSKWIDKMKELRDAALSDKRIVAP